MPASGRSRADENKRIRQEALREQLSNQKHVEKVIDNIEKIEGLDPTEPTYKDQVNGLKVASELRLKLVNKYAPDLKAVDIEGDVDTSLTIVRKDYKPKEAE